MLSIRAVEDSQNKVMLVVLHRVIKIRRLSWRNEMVRQLVAEDWQVISNTALDTMVMKISNNAVK